MGRSPLRAPLHVNGQYLYSPKAHRGPMRPNRFVKVCQNKASIFAIVCSVLKCSFVLGVRDKRVSWVAAFVATWVAPVPCQPSAGRQRYIPERNIIFQEILFVGSVVSLWPRSGCSLFIVSSVDSFNRSPARRSFTQTDTLTPLHCSFLS